MNKKSRLSCLKHNIEILKDHEEIYTEKFETEIKSSGTISIIQNNHSFPLFFTSLLYEEKKAFFIIEIFNFFQRLESNTILPYESYSQAITSYCLKLMAREKIIQIAKHSKKDKVNLKNYEEMIGSIHKKDIYMYKIIFYKKRDFTREDIPFLKNILNLLEIAEEIEMTEKNGQLYFKHRKQTRLRNIYTGAVIKNIYKQRKVFITLLKEVKEELCYGMPQRKKIVKKNK